MSTEESRREFRNKAIPAFVDLLLMAEEALVRYHKRNGDGEGPTAYAEHDLKDILMTANVMVSVGFAARGDSPQEVVLTESERRVRLDPQAVHDAFTRRLEVCKIDVPMARRVLAELVASEPGGEMLQLMLYDAVIVKRKANEAAKRAAGQPPAGGGE